MPDASAPSSYMGFETRKRISGYSTAAVVCGAVIGAALPATAVAQGCRSSSEVDCNGDGLTDVANADPDSTVAGIADSVRNHTVQGNDGTQTITPQHQLTLRPQRSPLGLRMPVQHSSMLTPMVMTT